MKRGGASVYFELDLAGNVRRLRGDAGVDHGGYRYTAFGKTVADDAIVVQPLRWKARWWQSLGANELYDMRARQWSPELGSFLSIDEYAFANSTTTLWGWPGQSPARWSDPDGRCGAACVGAVVGGVIGGLSYAATASTSMSWGDFAVGAAGAIGGGAAVGALAGVSPQAGFVAIGALGVASDKDLWKLGLAAPLATAGGGASCSTASAPARAVRTTPRNLAEKLTLDEARGGAGRRIMQGTINDPRYPEDVWGKMQHVHEQPDGTKAVIHYWENLQTGTREGFKFK